ncbi:MAG: mechanosensitive ion channel [Cyanobacteria bacterium P01_G01_bin.49]
MTTLTRRVIAQFPATGQSQNQQAPLDNLLNKLFTDGVTLVQAIFILLVGWIIASILKSVIKKLLSQTQIDNQIAAWITGRESTDSSIPIEKWISELVYWLIILFAVVACLNTLDLEAAYAPLNQLLGEITGFLPKILGAAVLLGIAWLLATLVKLIVTRILAGLQLDQRLGQQGTEAVGTAETSLEQTIGNALYWFIFLLFLPSILSTLKLQGTLLPVQGLLDEILAIIPNILAAIIIGAVGWVVAQIIRRVVTNLLAATPINQIGTKFGLSSETTGQSISQIIGTIVFVLILIPVAITALEALQIAAISQPATEMLNQVLNLLPKLFAATVVIGLSYVGGRYLSELVVNILTSVGFNNIFQWLGIAQTPFTPTTPAEPYTTPPTSEDPDTSAESYTTPSIPETTTSSTRTPSELVGIIVIVAVMSVASLTAVDILQIEALKTVVGTLLAIAAQVLVGLAVLALGLYLSNLCFNLITSSGTRQSKFLGHTARISILIFVVAMALQQMGIAPNIVNLAFGLLVGGIAAAIALAFGLGGREVAGEQLREWLNNFKQN